MIDQPSVACVCLTSDRPDMLARAVRCFHAQTYKNKRLLVYDTGTQRSPASGWLNLYTPGDHGRSVGWLRNSANANAVGRGVWHLGNIDFTVPDIIAHWDDDDWSDPIRLAQQVNMLQLSAAHCIGYHDMPFWDVAKSEAWLYRAGKPNYALGTSLMYWRRTWEAKPFPDIHNGEDTEWQRNLNVKTATSLQAEPRMIASIHGGNTNMAGYRINLTGKCEEFKRAPELDEVCRERMAL